MNRRHSTFAVLVSALFALFALSVVSPAGAAPEAHILRIDPSAGIANGTPLLTTVLEVVQFNRLSDALMPCASVTGYDQTLDCWSSAIEKPGALWSPFPFPEANARFFVNVAGADTLTTFASKEQWGAASKEPGVGTAWLIALDASSGMGARYADARIVAEQLIAAMQPNDLMDLIIFDDRPHFYDSDSKWKTYAQRNDLVAILNQIKSPMPGHGSDRPLFSQIKQMTQDAFGDLGNSKGPETIPLHQAMVVLSDGSGRGDPESASPSADIFHAYLDAGRFPADNTSLPKTPLPVVAIWFPATGGLANSLYKDNDSQFMQALANPEIGGYFDIVRGGQGAKKAGTIIGLVKQRFNAMWIVKWRLSCLNPTVTQTFNLVFQNTKPVIAPDGSFKDVPIGVDPTVWPLDVDVQKTQAEAAQNAIYPGGTFRVYGNFCWGGDKTRAEAYFVPAGTKPDPNANSPDPAVAKQAMQTLIAENMRGAATDVGDAFATFNVPNDDKLVEGTGDNAVAHVVLYDNKAGRTSGHDAKSILTLKAKSAPFNLLLILGVVGGVVVIGLLLIVLMRGGEAAVSVAGVLLRRRRSSREAAALRTADRRRPPVATRRRRTRRRRCPSHKRRLRSLRLRRQLRPRRLRLSSPLHRALGARLPALLGRARVERPQRSSRCGAPRATWSPWRRRGSRPFASRAGSRSRPAPSLRKGVGARLPPRFPLTGQLAAQLQPPANPYANGPSVAASAATIFGPTGQFTIRAGAELRIGRDPAQCGIFLQEPRISGVHATLRFEGGQLWVRDESSNNGTYLDGARIAAATWTPVAAGGQLRFGPIDFTVRLDA